MRRGGGGREIPRKGKEALDKMREHRSFKRHQSISSLTKMTSFIDLCNKERKVRLAVLS